MSNVVNIKHKTGDILRFWSCFNCKAPVYVSSHTFHLLEQGKLAHIKCQTCLNPPPKSAAQRQAA